MPPSAAARFRAAFFFLQRRVEDPAVAERVEQGGVARPPERIGWGRLDLAAELGGARADVVDLLRLVIFEADGDGHVLARQGHAGLAKFGKDVGEHHRAAVDQQFAVGDAQPVDRRHEGPLLGAEGAGVKCDGCGGGADGQIGRDPRTWLFHQISSAGARSGSPQSFFLIFS
jgi:hypothetical protein